MTCNNQGSPKWIFAMYLAINRRLYTRDRLKKWGITNDILCLLCKEANETHQHLFFNCIFSRRLWQKLLNWLSINTVSNGWTEELTWAVLQAKLYKQRSTEWPSLQQSTTFGKKGTTGFFKTRRGTQRWSLE